jgi:hypothetical protein
MTPAPLSRALALLRIVLAVVIVWLSFPTAFPSDPTALERHAGLGVFLRLLAGAEILGALMLLVPAMVRFGAPALVGVFAVAMGVHLLHGEYRVGPLLIYAAATLVVLVADRIRREGSGGSAIEP